MTVRWRQGQGDSPESVAVNAPTGPSDGVEIQTISQGRRPRTATTANSSPQTRNQRFARSLMVESTSALMIALSMLVIVSNMQRPAITSTMEIMSMDQDPIAICTGINIIQGDTHGRVHRRHPHSPSIYLFLCKSQTLY